MPTQIKFTQTQDHPNASSPRFKFTSKIKPTWRLCLEQSISIIYNAFLVAFFAFAASTAWNSCSKLW